MNHLLRRRIGWCCIHNVFTFQTPGSYPYVCQYHAGMQGTIVVQ